MPSAYKPSSSPSLRTEFALTAIITCPLKTNYSTSFLVVVVVLRPPPLLPFLLSRLPIIISTRMTLSACSPLLPFPRIPSHAPTPSFGLDTMMQAIIQPCRFLLYIPFDFFERKGLPTLSNLLYTFNEQPCYSLTGISSRPDFV